MGHHGSCRVSIPFLRVGLSQVNEFPAPGRVLAGLVIGNAARPGFARSGAWLGWVLPGWLTLANARTFAFSQALLYDSRQIVCPDLSAFQFAITWTRPCVLGFSRVPVLPGPGRFNFHLGFAGFCMCGSRVVPRQFVCAVWRATLC